MRQAGYCALRRSSPFQFWWIWRGKSRPRCSPQCIPVTRRRRFFFRTTGGVEETLGEALPLRQLPDRDEKPSKIRLSADRILRLCRQAYVASSNDGGS